ncbi:MAG: TatD family hydrolase [Duncaniella sp.]|nr:TatD family hydrolase [Muribaculum sp.]MCM1255181.1 TatD family hydrolase [Duncaniella sp.]
MFDWHTHRLRHNAIVDIDPTGLFNNRLRKMMPWGKGYRYSVGVHPWNVNRFTLRDLLMLRALASRPDVVAIGEAGLDTMRHSDDVEITLRKQLDLLKYHIELSEETAKPLILHIVRRFQEIIQLKKELRPTQPWIIHGFRGKPQLALQLLRQGFYLSYGKKYNPESYALTPPSRRLHETDQL